MHAESAPERKRELRRLARALGAGGDGAAVQQRLLSLPELRSAGTVALYAPLAGEVPLDEAESVLARRGSRLVFPRVEGEALVFHSARRAELRPGFRGVHEPAASSARSPIPAVDLFVVPGLLFDRQGRRLGRGLGLYDRALGQARAAARRVGLCYAGRLVAELPESEWDVPMHVVVTDEAVIRPGPETG